MFFVQRSDISPLKNQKISRQKLPSFDPRLSYTGLCSFVFSLFVQVFVQSTLPLCQFILPLPLFFKAYIECYLNDDSSLHCIVMYHCHLNEDKP